MEERTRLQSMSQTKVLEQYSGRDNVNIFALACESNTEEVSMKENGNDAIRKAIDVSNSIDKGLSVNDISVAHRSPSQKLLRPVKIRFSRRIVKLFIEQEGAREFERIKACQDLQRHYDTKNEIHQTDEKWLQGRNCLDEGRHNPFCVETKRSAKLVDYFKVQPYGLFLEQRDELFYWNFQWGAATRRNVNIGKAKEKHRWSCETPNPSFLSVKVLLLNLMSL